MIFRLMLTLLLSVATLRGNDGGPREEIINQATASFDGPIDSVLVSNTVVTVVAGDLRFSLTTNAETVSAAGSIVTFPHALFHLDDEDEGYMISLFNVAGSAFALEDLHAIYDANGNGVVDPGEERIELDQWFEVAGSASHNIIIVGIIPESASVDFVASIGLNVSSRGSGRYLSNVSRVTVVEGEDRIGLFVEKTADRARATIGDRVEYRLRTRNISSDRLLRVCVRDRLPLGFTYVPDSARLDDVVLADRFLPNGEIDFYVGEVEAGESIEITYQVRIGPNAMQGDGINRAYAVGPAIMSNLAEHAVEIEPGVFTDRGAILGRVFLDLDGDGFPGEAEPGVPGIRIFLEDGTYAITDAEGRYSFYGLLARTHVLKLDAITLPASAAPSGDDPRFAGRPGSRFVNLKSYETHRADFPVSGDSDLIAAAIEARRDAEDVTRSLARTLRRDLSADNRSQDLSDVRALPANGLVGGAEVLQTGRDAAADPAEGEAAPAAPTRPRTLEAAITADATGADLAIMAPLDGTVLAAPQTTLWIKGPLGASFSVEINGESVGADRLGQVVRDPANSREAWEYVGVKLVTGENRIEAVMMDMFGNERGRDGVTVLAPAQLGRIVVLPPADGAAADGLTPAQIVVRLEDQDGVPVTARMPVTLEATAGRWQVRDLDPMDPGIQVFITGGEDTFELLPPLRAGTGRIAATSGILRTEEEIAFVPALRPLIATGVIEGRIDLRGTSSLEPVGAGDSFEEALQAFTTASSDGKLTAGARAVFYLKGKVRGDTLLTAAYDSDKADRDRLFRDIEPDAYYPVYGDGAVHGFDAQSTGRLYVRLEQGQNYLLLGDFTTTDRRNLRGGASLGTYQRSLNGVRTQGEIGGVKLDAWASEGTSAQVVEELPADGTSGPFTFSNRDGILQSERVEIITRDRNSASEIIRTQTLSRFVDYEFEPFSGRLLLRAPVPSLDADLNPVSLRITYEVDQGGESFWTYGGGASTDLTDTITVGATVARDENPENHYLLTGATAEWKPRDGTSILAEVARSDSDENGEGYAGRIELRHKQGKHDLRAHLGRTEETFENQTATLLPGRTEGAVRITSKLKPGWTLYTEGVYKAAEARDLEYYGVRTELRHQRGAWNFTAGLRHSHTEIGAREGRPETAQSDDINSVKLAVGRELPFLKGASAYGEYERDLGDGRETVATGFDWDLGKRGRLYGRHEFQSELSLPFDPDKLERDASTVIGLERGVGGNGRTFSEYRIRDEFGDREIEAASGLRNRWDLREGVRLDTSFEKVHVFEGEARPSTMSATAAIDYAVNPDWRANGRLEWRQSGDQDTILSTLGYARRLDESWTALGRSVLVINQRDDDRPGDRIQGRLQAGAAYRPVGDAKWQILGKYEFRFDDATGSYGERRRNVHVLSTDINWMPAPRWEVSGRLAGKAYDERDGDLSYRGMAGLAAVKITRTFGTRWDAAIAAHGRFGDDVGGSWAIGPEVGVVLRDNLRLGVGYNVSGFTDEDFIADGSASHGFYLTMKVKFDENLFKGLREQVQEWR